MPTVNIYLNDRLADLIKHDKSAIVRDSLIEYFKQRGIDFEVEKRRKMIPDIKEDD